MTDKTLEQLQVEADELKAKMDAIKAAEKAEQERIEKEKRKIEYRKTMANNRAWKISHLQPIVDELIKLGYDKAAYFETDNPDKDDVTIKVFGHADRFEDIPITFDWNWSGDSWRARKTKPVIVVGSYNDRTRFPQKADKTFSYAKIAKKFDDKYQANIKAKKRKADKEATKAQSSQIAEFLREIYGVSEWGQNKVTPSEYHPDMVYVSIMKLVTEPQAHLLLKALKEIERQDEANN